MKMKRLPLWVMAAVWIALGLLLDGYLHCRVTAITQTGLTNLQVKKIGVVPFFKGRHTTEGGETLNCPYASFTSNRKTSHLIQIKS